MLGTQWLNLRTTWYIKDALHSGFSADKKIIHNSTREKTKVVGRGNKKLVDQPRLCPLFPAGVHERLGRVDVHRGVVYTYSRRWMSVFVAVQNFSGIEILVLQAFRCGWHEKTLGDTAVATYGNGFSCMAVQHRRVRMFKIN